MTDKISCASRLYEYFRELVEEDDDPNPEPVYVSTRVRREAMLGQRQGKLELGGTTRKLWFIEMGGGVWQCVLTHKFGG